ncbi:Dienelactone hydrolase family [Actinokineospora spheciospongiae]|uniref:Dienelactone hydrolase family n=1 Tax=Actinokineospora spheciospongiae TaxID=909613 RepID=W7ISR9_9PSEU|nr:dienelactone hydrolase family protein [Actinokineospora spheciospongiae]EWC63975.1 Dienelactone hydrolase family [Actinokineospora spheciospongiae]
MCHSTDSRPPALDNPGEVAEEGLLELTSADGTAFSAFRAIPAAPNGVNIVILPDIRGTHPYYQALANRFAQAGYTVAAIDYYGRTAGPGLRDENFEWKPLLPQVKSEEVAADVAAAAEYLTEFNTGPVFTVGFCFGGGQSWRMSATDLGVTGSIGFYGLPRLVEDVVDDISAPLLLLLAGEDVATSQDEFQAFAGKLDAAGKDYDLHVYEGAPHSFFDATYEQWQEACDDAWARMVTFIETHSAKVPA